MFVGFLDGDSVSQLPHVWYYISFQHTLEEVEGVQEGMCFRCLMFSLSVPCELLFLLCFIASWT